MPCKKRILSDMILLKADVFMRNTVAITLISVSVISKTKKVLYNIMWLVIFDMLC